MKREMIGLLMLLGFGVPGCIGQGSLAAPQSGRAGSAPDFRAQVVRGGVFHLREHRGRVVLIGFLQTQPDHGQDNPSRALAPMLLSVDRQYRAQGVDVLLVDETALAVHAVGNGTAKGAEPSLEALTNTSYDWSLTAPLAADPQGAIARIFGVGRVPAVLLIDPRGRIAQRWYGALHPGALAAWIEQIVGGPMKDRPPRQ